MGEERIGRRSEVQRDGPCHERTAPIQSVQVELHRYARVFHNHLLQCSSQRFGSVLFGLTRVISEAFAKKRTDSKAKPLSHIFDIVVDPSVRWAWGKIKWSFFSVLAIQAKKDF